MCCKLKIGTIIFFLFPGIIWAQQVLYSPSLGYGSSTRFEVAGRSGNFYWIQKSHTDRLNKRGDLKTRLKRLSFDVYDARLNLAHQIPYHLSDTVVKEYLVAAAQYFDQLLFTTSGNKTCLLLNRYTPDGTLLSKGDTLIHFPQSMQANAFLLVRSRDKRKVLLLGFEPVKEAPPRIHAILFNSNWRVISQLIHDEGKIAQPDIQYDFTNYPLEHFNSSPIKVMDNGDWLMVAPSRQSNDYVLWHFRSSDSTSVQNLIRQPQGPEVQQACLSLNDSEEVSIGILVNASSLLKKKVRIAHYKPAEGRVDFDTTYHFNTPAGDKSGEKYQFAQEFMSITGSGFLFLKEYGRTFRASLSDAEIAAHHNEYGQDKKWDDRTSIGVENDGYINFSGLTGTRSKYDPGNLVFHYFPAAKNDSCWTGLLNKEQATELNAAYLSYLCIPLENRLILLYNDLTFNSTHGNTTFLNNRGEALDEGLVFWKFNKVLDFQRARQIGMQEVAVPYKKNGQTGFSIIKL